MPQSGRLRRSVLDHTKIRGDPIRRVGHNDDNVLPRGRLYVRVNAAWAGLEWSISGSEPFVAEPMDHTLEIADDDGGPATGDCQAKPCGEVSSVARRPPPQHLRLQGPPAPQR